MHLQLHFYFSRDVSVVSHTLPCSPPGAPPASIACFPHRRYLAILWLRSTPCGRPTNPVRLCSFHLPPSDACSHVLKPCCALHKCIHECNANGGLHSGRASTSMAGDRPRGFRGPGVAQRSQRPRGPGEALRPRTPSPQGSPARWTPGGSPCPPRNAPDPGRWPGAGFCFTQQTPGGGGPPLDRRPRVGVSARSPKKIWHMPSDGPILGGPSPPPWF